MRPSPADPAKPAAAVVSALRRPTAHAPLPAAGPAASAPPPRAPGGRHNRRTAAAHYAERLPAPRQARPPACPPHTSAAVPVRSTRASAPTQSAAGPAAAPRRRPPGPPDAKAPRPRPLSSPAPEHHRRGGRRTVLRPPRYRPTAHAPLPAAGPAAPAPPPRTTGVRHTHRTAAAHYAERLPAPRQARPPECPPCASAIAPPRRPAPGGRTPVRGHRARRGSGDRSRADPGRSTAPARSNQSRRCSQAGLTASRQGRLRLQPYRLSPATAEPASDRDLRWSRRGPGYDRRLPQLCSRPTSVRCVGQAPHARPPRCSPPQGPRRCGVPRPLASCPQPCRGPFAKRPGAYPGMARPLARPGGRTPALGHRARRHVPAEAASAQTGPPPGARSARVPAPVRHSGDPDHPGDAPCTPRAAAPRERPPQTPAAGGRTEWIGAAAEGAAERKTRRDIGRSCG